MELSYRSPLATDALFAFLAARAIPGVEAVSGREYRRAVRSGPGDAVLRLRGGATGSANAAAIELDIEAVEPGAVAGFAGIARMARRALDLDADPLAIDALLAADDALRPLVAARPGMRLPGAFDGFATTVLAILAQGVTLASACTLAGRVARAHGRPLEVGGRGLDRAFPEPGTLAAADLASIGLTGRRATTLRAVATAVAEGRLDLGPDAEPGATLATLRAIPGIGPWTTGYVGLRILGDRDAFPPDDAAVRAAFRRLGLPSDAGSIAARAERWRPWRGYALAHLWSMA